MNPTTTFIAMSTSDYPPGPADPLAPEGTPKDPLVDPSVIESDLGGYLGETVKSIAWIIGVSLAAFVVLGAANGASAQSPIINLIAVDDNGDLPGVLDIVKRARAINERLGTPGMTRVWQATLAGDEANSVVIGVEYPSLEALAQAQAKQVGDSEWQKLIEDVQAKGISVTSNSVWQEITP